MNKNCKGYFFTADNKAYYRCAWDGIIHKDKLSNGDKCPNCFREIDGENVGEVCLTSVKKAELPNNVVVYLDGE